METVRTPEKTTNFWSTVFRYDFGVFTVLISIVSWILIVVWLFNEDMGGLGPRTNVVTKDYFNWHPFLMSTSFLLFMAPAIVSFEMYPLARHTNKNIHSFLMLIALISAFAGLAIILDCHNNLTNTGSFLTLHGSVGLFTLIALALNYIGGFVMYVLKCGGALRGTLKPLHKRLGLLTILLGLATITIGVQEKADKGGLQGSALKFTYGIGILVYATLGGVVFTVAKFVDKADAPSKTPKHNLNISINGTTGVNMANPNVNTLKQQRPATTTQVDETTKLLQS